MICRESFASNLKPPEQFLTDFSSPGGPRTYSFGFGYGCTWGSIILIFASVVLLICDRESEEIFYKERQVEEEEEEETGEAQKTIHTIFYNLAKSPCRHSKPHPSAGGAASQLPADVDAHGHHGRHGQRGLGPRPRVHLQHPPPLMYKRRHPP